MIISVAATTANLGPGFDTLGLALDLYNHFEVRLADDQDVQQIHPGSLADAHNLSCEPKNSLFFKTLDHFYTHIRQIRPGMAVNITANIPLARGLGSSSSVIVGALRTGSALSGVTLSDPDLLKLATEIEGHPDNVAPALLGGVQLCDDVTAYALPWPEAWRIAIWIPPYPLVTHQARAVMPKIYDLTDAVFNLRKTSLLVHALHTADPVIFSKALTDRLHQPYRLGLIPEWEDIYALAIAQGAMGVTISGAGPSLAIYYLAENDGLLPALHAWCERGNYQILPLSIVRRF